MSYAYLGPWHSPYIYCLCPTSDIAAEGATFNVLGYDMVWTMQRQADALRVIYTTVLGYLFHEYYFQICMLS